MNGLQSSSKEVIEYSNRLGRASLPSITLVLLGNVLGDFIPDI